MSALHLISVAFCSVLVVLATRNLPRIWRNEIDLANSPQSWWPGGLDGWKDFVRIMPTAIVAMWALLFFLVVGTFIPAGPKDQFGFVRPLWYTVPAIAVFVVSAFLAFSIVTFGRPRFLIPPRLRDGGEQA